MKLKPSLVDLNSVQPGNVAGSILTTLRLKHYRNQSNSQPVSSSSHQNKPGPHVARTLSTYLAPGMNSQPDIYVKLIITIIK